MAQIRNEFSSTAVERDDTTLLNDRFTQVVNAPQSIGVLAPLSVVATYTFQASGSSSKDGPESGRAVITVYNNNTMTVALTSLTANATSDGENLSSLKMVFASAPPTASLSSAVGQLIDIDGHGGYTNISGAITHWGTAVDPGNSKALYLATVGTGAAGGQPIDLITDTAGGSSNANSSFVNHQPQIANTATFTLTFTGAPPVITGVNFGFGTDLSISDHVLPGTPVCYLVGTQIALSTTETAAIESLKIGDKVLTHDGRLVPVLWIGRQTVSRLFADPLRILPIRIKAGALGDNLPLRDLLVSNCHAVLVENVLVQAGALVNGSSIVRETNMPATFVYYHVELEDHALILAEGVAAETFVDNASRMAFDNWSEHEVLFPEGRPIAEIDLPRVQSARQLPSAIKQRIAA